MKHYSAWKINYWCLQWYINRELPDVQAGFRKGRGTGDQIANIRWTIEKAREFQKTSTSASLTTLKPLTVWITAKCGKFLKRWEYQTTLPASWETCMQLKKQQLELNITNNRLIQNWERSVSRMYIVTLCILVTSRVHHVKCQGELSTSFNQDCQEKYQ